MSLAAALPLALLINLLLFGLLGQLIAHREQQMARAIEAVSFDFIRIPKRQEEPPPPRRRLPPPPRPKPPPQATLRPTSHPPRASVQKLPLPVPEIRVDLPTHLDLKAPELPQLLVAGEVAPGKVAAPGLKVISASELTPLVRVPPRYPFSARRRRIEGYVVVEFTVTETGDVEEVQVVEAQPRGVFERAAVEAVRHWRFQPKMEEGRPIRVRARQKIEFRLR